MLKKKSTNALSFEKFHLILWYSIIKILKMKNFVTKIIKSSKNITPFAGISYINSEFNNCGLSQLIDKELGNRVSTAGYNYSDIIRNWANLFICGGDCAEDVQVHLRGTLEKIPGNKLSSADTLLRGNKELAVENTQVVSSSGKTYRFNINEKMNNLNMKSLLQTGQLVKGMSYDLDFDNQIIRHNKYDASVTYKKNTGYFPGVASIGENIIYVENRDGNANVKMGQAETLQRVGKSLSEHDIYIYRSRMDAGSYTKDIIDAASQISELFYIRANKCHSLTERINQIDDWQKVEINFKEYQVASLDFTQFFQERGYRLVVMRELREDGKLDLFDGKYIYRCILTNDWENTEEDIILYYNDRGSSEDIFDVMNNDFGWKHLPCSDIHHNTVYLIITAMIKNFYNYIVKKVSEVFTDIPSTSRLKRFIFRFINVCGQWIYRSRQWILKLYTDRPYEKVFC